MNKNIGVIKKKSPSWGGRGKRENNGRAKSN
jgi:hypothetical protein